MEAAAAVSGFIGLVGTMAPYLKVWYDLVTDMKDCPKDIREMKIDAELVGELITQITRQYNERDERLRESAALARAVGRARESVEDLKKELTAYFQDGKRKRIKWAIKLTQAPKLRASLDRAKTNMLELKNQLQSDLLYDIRDTSQEVLRSVEKTNRNLETYGRNYRHVPQQSEVQAETTDTSQVRVETSVQLASDTSSEGLSDLNSMGQTFEHMTDLLGRTRISSPSTSIQSTPASLREVSDVSVMNSSRGTPPSSISSSPGIPRSTPQNARQADIVSQHPLLQFKDNQFQFLVAIIFTQRTQKHQRRLACQRASECLAAYPTPEALSKAELKALEQYFDGIGLQNKKTPQLIQLAQAYVNDPPIQGILRWKRGSPKVKSEIAHLPQIGEMAVHAWLVYCCERTDIDTEDDTLVEYMKHLKAQAGGNGL